MFEIAEARAAIFFFDRDTMQSQSADLRPEIARERVCLVDLVGARCDFVGREIAHGVADRIGGLAEIEIEVALGVRNHRKTLRLVQRRYITQPSPGPPAYRSPASRRPRSAPQRYVCRSDRAASPTCRHRACRSGHRGRGATPRTRR